jgi:hypothetical protein
MSQATEIADFQRSLPRASSNTLSDRLKTLEENGVETITHRAPSTCLRPRVMNCAPFCVPYASGVRSTRRRPKIGARDTWQNRDPR